MSFLQTKLNIITKKLYTALLVIIFGFLFWKFSIETAILWIIFLAFLFYNWETRILVGVALAFLISCPILLIFEKETIAEKMAIYTYFLLTMTVVLQIVEYKRHPEVFEEKVFVKKRRLVLDIIPKNINEKGN